MSVSMRRRGFRALFRRGKGERSLKVVCVGKDGVSVAMTKPPPDQLSSRAHDLKKINISVILSIHGLEVCANICFTLRRMVPCILSPFLPEIKSWRRLKEGDSPQLREP